MRPRVFQVALLAIACIPLAAKPPQKDPAYPDTLNFFNSWFVTGNYASAGVGLSTTGGAGSMTMSGVPCTSGIGPAASIVPCSTAGSIPATPVAAYLYWETVESTNTPTGANGMFDGFAITGTPIGFDPSSACWVSANPQTLRTYRADVLRFLPLDAASRVLANGVHTVKLGTAAGDAAIRSTQGASLVVIYKIVVPGKPLIAPLRAITIYDGTFTLNGNKLPMTQTVAGFYQAAATPAAMMTHIVGNGNVGPGAAQFRGNLTVDGVVPPGITDHPFSSAQGLNWDNLTYAFNLAPNAASTSVSMARTDNAPSCLTWASIITSTNVQDSDNDGLLDIWESKGLHRNTKVAPATFGTCADYPNEPCVNLPAMGAVNGVKDIFVQLDWMHGTGDGTGGINGTGSHSHIPKLGALTMVANAFSAHGIALHFDVGNNYQGLNLPYIIPASAGGKAVALGGSDMDESSLVCHDSGTQICGYHVPYPVLSFKLGYQSIRDGNSLVNLAAHFSPDRLPIFHEVLFAHALGGPYDGATGKPKDSNPKSTSGIADRPGADVMITLGLWRSDISANDQVGSVPVQAGTLMHELGHNLDLSHSGWYSTPNCSPNYPSVMSYLYQTRGLTDINGSEQIDYSNGLLAPLNENSLSATTSLGSLKYRLRYYGPVGPNSTVDQAAKAHCDGTPINGGSLAIRLESPGLSTPDWSNGTVKPLGNSIFDVNYDGVPGEMLGDQPDWSSLNLQQIGGRPNFGSSSGGSSATDIGSAATDLGSAATDLGSAATDLGSAATDLGSAATDLGSAATDLGQDEDYDTHIKATTDAIPPPSPQCPSCGLKATNELQDIKLSWTPPDEGGSLIYNIYRCAGAGCDPRQASQRMVTGFVPASKSAPVFIDTVNDFADAGATCPSNKTCYNTVYTYSATAVSTSGTESPFSNTDTSEVTHLFVIADNQTVTYGNLNPAPTFKIYGDIAGTLNGVTCVYTPASPRNVGNYPITCSGPATTSPTDGVTYNAAYITYTPGTLTINQRPITVTAVAANKVYDGTTASTVKPMITSGTLAYSDTANFIQTYDSRNVGAARVLTPSGSVSDGNGGLNYKVTFATISPCSITQRPITVTAVTSTKTYDGNTSSTAVPTITSGTLASGDTTAIWTETYDNKNFGTTHVMTPAGSVSDGNSGNNYLVTFAQYKYGTITAKALTIKADDKSIEDEQPTPPLTATPTGLAAGESLQSPFFSGTLKCVLASVRAPDTFYPNGITISCSGLTSPNYTITWQTGKLTVYENPNGDND